MPQFAKSLFVAYATRNKRMPDFKCTIIVLINKKTKAKSTANCVFPAFETRGIRASGKKKEKKTHELLPARHSCSRD